VEKLSQCGRDDLGLERAHLFTYETACRHTLGDQALCEPLKDLSAHGRVGTLRGPMVLQDTARP
jgi:hypothetical protein